MAEAQENKVSGSGEAWNTTEFVHEYMSIWRRMTDDDKRRLNEQLRQMEEQKTGLYAFLNENSDDTSKQSNEVSEGVSESKIVENGSHEIKHDIGDTIENVTLESDNNVVNDSEEIINQVRDNDDELINNSDKIMGEVGLTSEDNDGDDNSEVSGDINIINYSDEIMVNNNNDIVESEVLDNDEIEIVSGREKVIDCKGVVINVEELDNEWKERVAECVGQRVNFPLICDEPRCSKMVLLEGKRPYLMKDLNYFPFLYKIVPSVWYVESVIWCYDKKDLDGELCVDKETELYKLKRDYNELTERLNDLKYLPVKIKSEDYFCLLYTSRCV